jgi:hypothetical protein
VNRLVALLLIGAMAGTHVWAARPNPQTPPLQRVALLMLENRSWGQVIGNRKAPYLNSLASNGALATNYFAITHPSLPNYVALTTGAHDGINHDCTSCRVGGRNLVNQLDAAGISWRAYFESIGRAVAATAPVSGAAYDPHYDPFAYMSSLRGPDLTGDVTNFAGLHRDLAARRLPRFSWIGLNLRHDGHNESIRVVDGIVHRLVPKIVRALGPRGALFITWDEGRRSDIRGAHGSGGGHIPLMVVGPAARDRARVAVRADHYALLRTVEGALGLPLLGHAANPATPTLGGLLATPQASKGVAHLRR